MQTLTTSVRQLSQGQQETPAGTRGRIRASPRHPGYRPFRARGSRPQLNPINEQRSRRPASVACEPVPEPLEFPLSIFLEAANALMRARELATPGPADLR